MPDFHHLREKMCILMTTAEELNVTLSDIYFLLFLNQNRLIAIIKC